MNSYRIAAIPGDGIGKETLPEGLKALRAVAELTGDFSLQVQQFPWGCEHYLHAGEVMPKGAIDTLRNFDAIYFGAAGHPDVPDYLGGWELIFVIRHAFDQYVNLRPAKLFPGVVTPLANKGPDDVDFAVVRENTEGEFAGPGGRVHRGRRNAVAIQTSVFTYDGVARVASYAFELAQQRRGKVTNITKSNALHHSLTFWDDVVEEVASEYPDVQCDRLYVDAAMLKMVEAPEHFDVIVTTNMFGDILSDLAGAIAGGIGLGASGNINPDRSEPSMFEPFHGSAPDIAGRGIANPLGTIWAGAMMLEHLGEGHAAARIMQAIERTLASGVATADLGGGASTIEMGDAVIRQLAELASEPDV